MMIMLFKSLVFSFKNNIDIKYLVNKFVFNAYISVLKAVFEGCLLKDVTEIEICTIQFELFCFVLDFWKIGQPVNSARLNTIFIG